MVEGHWKATSNFQLAHSFNLTIQQELLNSTGISDDVLAINWKISLTIKMSELLRNLTWRKNYVSIFGLFVSFFTSTQLECLVIYWSCLSVMTPVNPISTIPISMDSRILRCANVQDKPLAILM
jgi:hypothetical protein